MAEKQPKKKLVIRKKQETIREKADKSAKKLARTPRTRKLKTTVSKPVGKVGRALGKEFHPIKTSDSKVGRILGKRQSLAPSYFVQAFRELKQVTWPSKKTVFRLTFAVLLFSTVLAAVIKGMDYGFDKLFKDVIIK